MFFSCILPRHLLWLPVLLLIGQVGVETSRSESDPTRARAWLVYIYKARDQAHFGPHILSSSSARKFFHKLKLGLGSTNLYNVLNEIKLGGS